MQVLPALGNVPPEARLNLAIHHLRSGGAEAAEALLQDVSPSTPHEYILKVCVCVCVWLVALSVCGCAQALSVCGWAHVWWCCVSAAARAPSPGQRLHIERAN
jgi:hypothetical protein